MQSKQPKSNLTKGELVNLSKKSLIIASALSIIGVSSLVVSTGMASAQGAGRSDNLVQKIADKFNLDKEEVESVLDEERSTRESERQQKVSDRLQQLVDDGEITAEQKTLIENKQKELQEKRETERTELKNWAEEHDIDLQNVMPGHGGHKMKGRF